MEITIPWLLSQILISLMIKKTESTITNFTKSEKSFDILIQVGEQHSASTRQFQALQVIASITHPGVPVIKAYSWAANCDTSNHANIRISPQLVYNSILVLKFHNPGAALGCVNLLRKNLDDFLTANGSRIPKELTIKWFTSSKSKDIHLSAPAIVTYHQQYRQIQEAGLAELQAYRKIFNLTEIQMNWLLTYMRYWSILRQCCGGHAAEIWKKQLNGAKIETESMTDWVYPACEIYNLTAVEQSLRIVVKSAVFGPSLQNVTLSKYNGSFCMEGIKKLMKTKVHKSFGSSLR
eukprot:m.71906 g.71906  ORF g.71906 m.71906 type:complete len:293 (+) comp12287_c0_seq2:142-1020(+)